MFYPLIEKIMYTPYRMNAHSSCYPSSSPLSILLASYSYQSSIPIHSFSLPLSLTSRCHDLFSGCLNRLAVIKSYAPLMTLS